MSEKPEAEQRFARLWQLLWSCCEAPEPLVLFGDDGQEVLFVGCAHCGEVH